MPGTQGPTAEDPPAERIAADLAGAVGRLARRMRTASPDSLLTPTQRTVMARLDREGPATTAALARAEYVRPQSMRLTVGALEERGFVSRAPDPDDGRQSVVSVTDAGREVLASVRAAKQSWLARTLDSELDAAERRTLAEAIALLERLTGT
ncbi:MarR family transcriptional regulator [Streptomyces sp. SID5785]|uniref:MarR family winged helix-turn-helix transcriptional regulator n=1 Tax=Streptomyces sp. SID5785 TaxID=2690309 RepID=UPI001360EE38|nr:MarR family transcriptional regulator [Streptomyces sp. SID5785]MZD03886.1 MarR family transcriptional regulator [Streptomyces sp. SID5785]